MESFIHTSITIMTIAMTMMTSVYSTIPWAASSLQNARKHTLPSARHGGRQKRATALPPFASPFTGVVTALRPPDAPPREARLLPALPY